MANINQMSKAPPAAVVRILSQLGRNIRTARLRRKLRLIDLAERVGISRYLMADIEKGKPSAAISAYIGATTITTLDYLLTKSLSAKAVRIIKKLLKLFEIAPVNRLVLEDALDSGFIDFEDAVLYGAAIHCGVQAIVTRDQKGFHRAQLAIYSPEALLNTLSLETIESV